MSLSNPVMHLSDLTFLNMVKSCINFSLGLKFKILSNCVFLFNYRRLNKLCVKLYRLLTISTIVCSNKTQQLSYSKTTKLIQNKGENYRLMKAVTNVGKNQSNHQLANVTTLSNARNLRLQHNKLVHFKNTAWYHACNGWSSFLVWTVSYKHKMFM
jgi:hypothetical protein